jgi:hypothetical protein
VIATKATA